ncbi:diacylglycerol/lipid kinase family protein [Microbacterium sediminis]|uniref:Sphingosine kinase n=1 Tax=Microbacterium sediminis TaxID=904291 RepID=A0A1B9NHP3_9MICO|nr:diacylglycerol kinase family protein [Microbacterium sediminis]OCG76121.1 sphingosine kinase [Microbacterium sediminis]
MTSADTAPKRAALVYNPSKTDGADLRARVTTHSAHAGWAPPLLLETTVEDPGQGVTRWALSEGATTVLVAGGDGTVRAVAEALDGTGVPLAIVPSGTGNLLARNLLLPLASPEAMVTAAFEGDRVPVDVGIARLRRADGETEEHAFVVMAGMGLDAAMIANTNSGLKKSVGWVAYVDGAARSLIGAEPFRIVYHVDPRPDQGGSRTTTRLHSAKVHSILVANCGALPAGIALIPDASITDGSLDVAIIQPTGPFGWFGVWRKVWWDNSVLRRFRAGRRIVERRKDSSIRFLQVAGIETATPAPQPVELDGDPFGEAVRMDCAVHPGGLLVAVPRGHPTAAL